MGTAARNRLLEGCIEGIMGQVEGGSASCVTHLEPFVIPVPAVLHESALGECHVFYTRSCFVA